ncbi:MAG: hypothetical protein WBE69_01620 [Candidatus Binataceae bacterium]
MTPVEGAQSRADEKAGWSTPLPEKNPPSTYAPVFLALGITFLLFGIVSSYVFSAAGLILMVVSISKWVGELLHGE